MLPATLKLIAALGIVLGLLLLLYYWGRRGLPGLFPAARSSAIKLIEVRHLMPRRALFLVEVRGRELLLGVGSERIELLTTVDWQPGGSFVEALKIQTGQTRPTSPTCQTCELP